MEYVMTIRRLCLLASLALLLSGCATTYRDTSHKTLALTAMTVDKALVAYSDAYVAGKVDAATHAKVEDLKGRYEKAFVAAVAAAKANLQSPTPDDLVQIATLLVTIVKEAL